MAVYQSPVGVYFVWHPADYASVHSIVDHCYEMLHRDINKPFSRSMNVPIFFRTSMKKGIPAEIKKQSKHTLVFIFTSKNLVSDDKWIEYIDGLPKNGNFHYIPISLDEYAYKIGGKFQNVNFIRAHHFKEEFINQLAFISVAHEIFRLVLNDDYNEMELGKDNALEIFISHAKDGKIGLELAKSLKKYIDNSQMRNFFDATDIAPGYLFNEEIIGHIKKSTLIAIHSDPYSSRYWCQREIMCAKEFKRPIVAIDCLEEFEDRRFPYASNIPGIHVDINEDRKTSEKDLLRILSVTLLETVRYHYAKLILNEYKSMEWLPSEAIILSRPPEAVDILRFKEEEIDTSGNLFLYPEPPVYEEELLPLKTVGYKFHTPLSFNPINLHSKTIGLSISDPSEEELIEIGQCSNHLISLSQEMARHLLARGSTLVYGGDLRENGFTDFIFKEASALQTRLQTKDIHIENYLAWPIYTNDSYDVIEWKAKYRDIAKMCEMKPSEDVNDLIPNINSFLIPINAQNQFVWSRCLSEMRNELIKKCHVRICAGGRLYNYKGKMPGVLEEIQIALELKKPLFLLGGFGGVTKCVCKSIQMNKTANEITKDWQIKNNSGYSDLLNFALERGYNYSDSYDKFDSQWDSIELYNGLTPQENERLFFTPFIDEAIYLVLKGIGEIFNKP